MSSSQTQANCPPKFVPHVHEKQYEIDRSLSATWWWLMQPETFTDGQPWPFRVEFIDTTLPDGTIARGFDVGTLNAHHGPFMNFCGVIAEVNESETECSRRLDYTYGAYALGFRLIRPTALTIKCVAESESKTRVTVRIDSFVRPWMAGLWTFAQGIFWRGFSWMMRSIPKTTPTAAAGVA